MGNSSKIEFEPSIYIGGHRSHREKHKGKLVITQTHLIFHEMISAQTALKQFNLEIPMQAINFISVQSKKELNALQSILVGPLWFMGLPDNHKLLLFEYCDDAQIKHTPIFYFPSDWGDSKKAKILQILRTRLRKLRLDTLANNHNVKYLGGLRRNLKKTEGTLTIGNDSLEFWSKIFSFKISIKDITHMQAELKPDPEGILTKGLMRIVTIVLPDFSGCNLSPTFLFVPRNIKESENSEEAFSILINLGRNIDTKISKIESSNDDKTLGTLSKENNEKEIRTINSQQKIPSPSLKSKISKNTIDLDPLRILKIRLAKGEIDKDEYLELKKILEE